MNHWATEYLRTKEADYNSDNNVQRQGGGGPGWGTVGLGALGLGAAGLYGAMNPDSGLGHMESSIVDHVKDFAHDRLHSGAGSLEGQYKALDASTAETLAGEQIRTNALQAAVPKAHDLISDGLHNLAANASGAGYAIAQGGKNLYGNVAGLVDSTIQGGKNLAGNAEGLLERARDIGGGQLKAIGEMGRAAVNFGHTAGPAASQTAGNLGDEVVKFHKDTVPEALQTVGETARRWGKGFVDFHTKTVPAAAQTVGDYVRK